MLKHYFRISAFIIFVSILSSSLKAYTLHDLPLIGEYKSTVFTKVNGAKCNIYNIKTVMEYGNILDTLFHDASYYYTQPRGFITYYQHVVFFNIIFNEIKRDCDNNGWNDLWRDTYTYKVSFNLFARVLDLKHRDIRNYEADKTSGIQNPVINFNDLPKILELIKGYSSPAKPSITPQPFNKDEKVVAASSGSGFFVSSVGHIVTNYHVIEECNFVFAFYKGSGEDTKVLFIDKTNDLAIIKANVKPDKVYAVRDEDVSLLEDIIIAGYPLGKKVSSAIKTSKGSVTALAGFGDNYSNFQTDAALNPGNSGGPMMDQNGNILGVAVANYGKKSGVESFNFGIKSSTLKTFANSNNFEFAPASKVELTNKDLGKLITEATIYLECWMSEAKIKQLIAEMESRKAFFSDYK